MPDIKQLIVRFRVDLKGVDQGIQELNSKLDRTRRDIDQRYGTLLDDMGKSGRAFTYGLTLPVLGIGAAAIKAAIDMESMERGLIAVTGSAAAAEQQMKRMIEVAKMPGLGFKEAIQGSLQLQAVGFNASEAEKALKGFANAISRVGGGRNEMAHVLIQLTQMAGKGRILQEDIRFIQNFVPEMARAMKALYGITDPETISKTVGAKQFALEVADYFLKLKGVSDTAKNSLENLSDTTFRAAATFGKQLLPTLKDTVDAASELLGRFQSLSPEQQQFAIKAALMGAALGPALLGIKGIIGAGSTAVGVIRGVRGWMLKKAEATAAAAAATKAEIAWLAAMTGSEEIATAAVMKNTVAVNANAVAQTTLLARAKAFVAGHGLTLAFAAATAAVILLEERIRRTNDAIDDMARKTAAMPRDIEESGSRRYQKQLGAATDENLENRLRTTTRQIREAERQIREAESRTRWGEVPNEVVRYDIEMTKSEIERLQKQRAAIQGEIDSRDATTQSSVKQVSEDQKKALAANEEANRVALQQKHILSQTNEHDRAIAEAWVELTNKKAEIAAKAREAKDKFGVILDTQAQLVVAQHEYNQKVKEAKDGAAEAAADANTSVIVAGIELEALKTRNTYEAERLRVQAQLTQTVRELTREKASEVAFKLAEARAAQQIGQINEREQADKRDRIIGDAADSAIADAIRRGDEYGKADVEAAAQFMRAYNEYVSGKISAAAMDRGLAEFNEAIRENQERKRKDLDRQQKEEQGRVLAAYEKQLATWRDTVSTLGEGKAAAAEMVGDTQSAALARFQAEAIVKEEELRRRRREAATDEEKRLAGILETNWAAEKQRKTLDILTGGVQSFYDRLKARKDEAVRGWEEQAQAARAYYDEMKGRLTIGTMDAAWRREMETGLRVSLPEPFIPPPPSTQITQTDIETEFRALNRANTDQVQLLDRIARSLESLAPVPGWSGA